MSIDVMNAVQRLNLHGTAKAVLLKMADMADDLGGNTFLSIETISKATSVSRPTVKRQIHLLMDDGVLTLMGEAKDKRQVDGDGRCGKGRTRCFRINVDIARGLYGHWTGRGWKTFSAPEWLELPGADAKGVMVTPFRAGLKGVKNPPKGFKTDCKGTQSLNPKPSGTLENQAPAGAAARGAAPSSAGESGGAPAPACAVWRDNRAAIEARLGMSVCRGFLTHVIPTEDDGETLTLAASTWFYRDHVAREYGAALGEVLGRTVVVVHCSWVSRAVDRMTREAREPWFRA